MKSGWGILIGAIAIAVAIGFTGRYRIAVIALPPNYVAAWRIDTWTGQVLYCDKGDSGEACEPVRILGQR